MQNLSLEETKKFDDLASSWWDPAGECKPLHEINPTRLKFIQQHCEINAANTLDVGCGGGLLTESLAKLGAHVTGIDASEKVIQIAKLHAKESNLDIAYEVATAESFAAGKNQSYDIVTCLELLEHVPDPAALVSSCAALARPGAKVFFSTLNRNLAAYLFGVVAAEYVLRLLPIGTHDYSKFIRPHELRGWCEAAKLQVQAIKGIKYNPLLKSCELCDNLSVNYIICATKI